MLGEGLWGRRSTSLSRLDLGEGCLLEVLKMNAVLDFRILSCGA